MVGRRSYIAETLTSRASRRVDELPDLVYPVSPEEDTGAADKEAKVILEGRSGRTDTISETETL